MNKSYYPVFEETGGFDYPDGRMNRPRFGEPEKPISKSIIAVVETSLKINGNGLLVKVSAKDDDGETFEVTKTRSFQDVEAGKVPDTKIVWKA